MCTETQRMRYHWQKIGKIPPKITVQSCQEKVVKILNILKKGTIKHQGWNYRE